MDQLSPHVIMSSHPTTLRVGLATARLSPTLDAGVERIRMFLRDAAAQDVDVVCLPESYLPGIRCVGYDIPAYDHNAQERALAAVCAAARDAGVAAVVPMDWQVDGRLHNAAHVVGADGTRLGFQTKNQIPPEEESDYAPGHARHVFEVAGARVGVVICHEGWRYPETVRWAARHGAQVVFHPHYHGSETTPAAPHRWCDPDGPFHELAMRARAAENTVYYAGVNYALPNQECASAVVAPDGTCVARAPYGEESLLVADLDLSAATGLYAHRLAPERYPDLSGVA